MSIPDGFRVLQMMSANVLNWEGAAFLLLAALGVCLFIALFTARRLRRLGAELRDLSEEVKDQARALDSLRRHLETAVDQAAGSKLEPRGSGRDEQVGSAALSAALIREELETLRAEIFSHEQPSPPER